MKKLLLLALLPTFASAATFNGAASVNITGVPINVNAVQPLNFGSLTKPTTAGASYRVASDGTKTATNITQTNFAAVQPATFTIDAPSGLVNVTITDVSTVSGLTLSNFDFNYAGTEYSSSTAAALPGGIGIPMSLGAQLNVDPSVAMGVTHAAYNVQVDYQ